MLGSDTCPLYAEPVTLAPAADAEAGAADRHAVVMATVSSSVNVASSASDRDARLGDEQYSFIVPSFECR
jgi:hypothetical protein